MVEAASGTKKLFIFKQIMLQFLSKKRYIVHLVYVLQLYVIWWILKGCQNLFSLKRPRSSLQSILFLFNNYSFKIIRRQIALVIKSWISVKVSKRSRTMAYDALLKLSGDADTVVKLTSMISLRQCVDDFDFELEDFMPFVAPAISQCLGIIDEYEEFESKLCILNTISVIVLRLESKV